VRRIDPATAFCRGDVALVSRDAAVLVLRVSKGTEPSLLCEERAGGAQRMSSSSLSSILLIAVSQKSCLL
jgi:hypothetical protein